MNNPISLNTQTSASASAWLKPICLAAALLVGAGAQAAPSLGSSDVSFQAGQPISVVLNFDFEGDVTFAAYDLFVSFDSSLLNIDATTPFTVTGGGFTGDTSEQVSFVNNAGGAFALSYLPSSLPNVGATSPLQLTLNFTALPGFTLGQSTDVSASFIYATTADPFNTVDISTSSQVTAAAVPEPESLALMLAGLGIVSVCARRRAGKGAVHA